MNTKLKELTDKIYKDGVQKGEEKADQIINDARTEAEKIIEKAKNEAETIVQSAKSKAEETRRNTQSEMKLVGQQALSDIRQRIVSVITHKVVDEPVDGIFNDKDFLKKMIEKIIQAWNPQKQERVDLNLVLSDQDKNELEKYFQQNGKKILDNGVDVHFSKEISGGIRIGPKEGSYVLSFTEEDFKEFFKSFLRPKTSQYLYGE